MRRRIDSIRSLNSNFPRLDVQLVALTEERLQIYIWHNESN